MSQLLPLLPPEIACDLVYLAHQHGLSPDQVIADLIVGNYNAEDRTFSIEFPENIS